MMLQHDASLHRDLHWSMFRLDSCTCFQPYRTAVGLRPSRCPSRSGQAASTDGDKEAPRGAFRLSPLRAPSASSYKVPAGFPPRLALLLATLGGPFTMSLPVSSILAVRYMSAVGVTAILYDHCLTLFDEIKLIWFNSRASTADRINFLLNRYTVEAMIIYVAYVLGGMSSGLSNQVCKNFIWVFGVVGSVSIAIQQFTLVARVYTLWDKRQVIKWIVLTAFMVQTGATTVFSILASYQLQPFTSYSPVIHMCIISHKPWALPATTGSLAAFGLFIILMTLWNALDKPYRKQSEVVDTLVRDGARMFVLIFILTVVNFVMTLVGEPSDCLVTLVVVVRASLERLSFAKA
uniref:DUF6533 domain-containing protein n=1 Tax=Mycena chlorophos TaxID=658473 RepID=A0ABQ0M887_MYCCL|nr:predicted protein [Mycena chlorophos]